LSPAAAQFEGEEHVSPSSVEENLASRFICAKCGNHGGRTRALSMSGVGLSRLFDIQMNKYVFVSCNHCGYTEVYDYNKVESGGMDLLDILFSGG
jgi:predicted nucleic-acid-binding Zn-ribbon protein